MKKFLKYFLIVPIIFIAIFTLFACNDDEVKSINLSIPDYTITEEGYYVLDKKIATQVPLNVSIEPDIFSANNLDFKSSNEDIAMVRKYKGNVNIILGKDLGMVTITASFTKKDKSVVSSSIKIIVSDTTSNIYFDNFTYEAIYSGEDISNNYSVVQDDERLFNYSYFNIDNGEKEVSEIVNVGRYKIVCINPQEPNDKAETYVIVKKVKLNNKLSNALIANNYQAFYGDSLPTDLYYEGDVPDNVLAATTSTKIVYGIGKDSATAIGKAVEITPAFRGSNVGVYLTTVRMSIFTEFEANYSDEYDTQDGMFRIYAKEVILKGKNQTSIYGDRVKNSFDLYSYSDYLENDNSTNGLTPLDSSKINYSKDVGLGNVVYKLNGSPVTLNSVGHLDVLIDNSGGGNFDEYGAYDVFFDNATVSKNLVLKGVESGTLTVTPRGVTILPKRNQFKNYGQTDPSSYTYDVVAGSFISHDQVVNPLRIVYKTVDDNPLGDGNYLAKAGNYYFSIDDSVNKNYDILLDERAIEESQIAEEEKVVFEVRLCPIVIKLKDKEVLYKTPTGITENGQTSHKVGYYGNADDYKLEIETLTIDGKDADLSTIDSGEEGQLGKIRLNTVGYFSFVVGVSKVTNPNYYLSYETIISGVYYGDEADGANYDVIWQNSNLNVMKRTIIVTPNQDLQFSKVYDATNDDSDLFSNKNLTYYTARDEEGNAINLEEVVDNYDSLLTLIDNNEYSKLDDNGISYTKVSSFKDVGKYKIFLLNEISIRYVPGMEYYQLILDDNKDYNFEITPFAVFITPHTDQGKIYGMKDQVIRYSYTNLPEAETELTVEGSLSRVSGEDANEYAINLGSLSFGMNYRLYLDTSNLAVYTIRPRTVNIMPYSYSYVYGDVKDVTLRYTTEIEGKNEYDASILVEPQFNGEFSIVRNKDDLTSVVRQDSLGYYPVNISDGNVLSYSIALGSFCCTTNNYVINFIDTSTFTITKREATINISEERWNGRPEDVETNEFVLNTNYEINNLVGAESVVSTLKIVLNINSYYCTVNTFDLSLSIAGEDVTQNYNIVKGKDVVYRFDMAVVSLSIVTAENERLSTYESTYKGTAFEDLFKLVSLTDGYQIDYDESNFTFVYVKGAQSYLQAKDVGNYVVKIDTTRDDFKIVLTNNGNQIIYTKDTFNTEVGNAVLNISNSGYLNIRKAKIEIKNSPKFAKPLMYGDTTLPLLSQTTDDNEPIFVGVNNELILLKTYEDTGLNYVGSGYSFSNFQANYSYNIIVTIQAVKLDGSLDNNYETLTIPAVSLKVLPRQIGIESSKFTTRNGGTDFKNIIYDGNLKSLILSLEVEETSIDYKNYYTITYSYQRLAIFYENSISGQFYYRNFDVNTNAPTGDTLISDCDRLPTNITSFEIRAVGRNFYAIVNKSMCILMESGSGSGVSPDNAGAYICVATCNAFENYTFTIKDENNQSIGVNSNIQFACMFEIKRSNDVTITNWKDSFYYNTKFDFTNPSTLPFEYNIYPSYLKDYVEYSMNNYGDISTGGNLGVGTYTAILTIDTESYYIQFNLKFNVEKLAVEFIFPSIKTYVYIGKDVPVTSFLSNIRVVLKRSDGTVDQTFYYDPYTNVGISKYIVLKYYDADTREEILNEEGINIAPYRIGDYILKMVYGTQETSGTDNYYGEGEFEYSIVTRTFSGAIRIDTGNIYYNPLYTQEKFYEEIIDKMVIVDYDGRYNIDVYIGNEVNQANKINVTPDDEMNYPASNPQDLGWLRVLNNVGAHYLTFVVTFPDDDTLTPVIKSGTLTTKRKSLAYKDFDFLSTTQSAHTYTGKNIYNYIAFGFSDEFSEGKKINLDPDMKTSTFRDGDYVYHFSIGGTGNNKYVEVKDNMFYTIFELRYSYKSNSSPLDYAPIEPGSGYSVTYNIFGGDNYMSGGVGTHSKDFVINKLDVLYLYFRDNWDTSSLVYSGKSLVDKTKSGNDRTLGKLKIKDLIIVKSDDALPTSNLNFTLFDTSIYKDSQGIYLQVFFTDAFGNIVENDNVIDAGKYKMNLSLAFTKNYSILKYFNKVNLGGTIYNAGDFVQSLNGDKPRSWCEPYLVSKEFEVEKAPSNYSINTWNSALKLFDDGESADVKLVNNELIVTSLSGLIKIIARGSLVIEIKMTVGNDEVTQGIIQGEEGFDLRVGQSYNIYIKGNQNYKDSDAIRIVINGGGS